MILSVARVPQPRIGSFEFCNDGTITLTNRPLTCGVMILESNGAPRVTQRHETYTCIDPYISDLLTLHDGRFLAQPNAVNDKRDCHFQMAVQALLRTVSHYYCGREQRYGPFVMQFSDLHASNLLVDENWNITGVIDLEWMCARPAGMVDVPYWITGLGIDEVGEEENFAAYQDAREEFMAFMEEEERQERKLRPAPYPPAQTALSIIMRQAWVSKSSWFVHCLDSINGMYAIFDQHLRPQFIDFYLTEKMEAFLSKFWCEGSSEVVARKLMDREEYLAELRKLFMKDGTEAILKSGKGERPGMQSNE